MDVRTDEELINENLSLPKSWSAMEFKTSTLDDILHEKLENAFHKQTSTVSLHDIAKIAIEHTPIDLAYAVSHLPPNARPVLYDNLPDIDAKIKFVLNTDQTTRQTIFRYMGDLQLRDLFEKMPIDKVVSVLEDVSERRTRRIIELIEPKKAARIKETNKHHRNSAARLMTSEFFAFPMEMTIGEVSSFIRDYPRIDFTRGIYVLGEGKKLQGYVPGRNMIINPSSFPIKQVMRPVAHYVGLDATREEVVDIVERYKISSLPVVDSNGYLKGVIAYEDVMDVMEDLADETFAKMAGITEKVTSFEPLLMRFLARSPWLVVTLIAGLINFSLMSFFQSLGGALLTFVLFFVPLITGMSGNIGIQCSTVLVRSMAVGTFSSASKKDAVTRELLIGLFTGVIFGIGCGLVVYLISLATGYCDTIDPLSLGVIVGVGLVGACFAGTSLGVFSPLFFSKIGVDPAIASGPIVTAFNDILSMSIYFVIALGLSAIFL